MSLVFMPPPKKIEQLSKETARQISSGQVITSVFSVVKELIENSLDAEAASIDIKVEDSGLTRIEVRDNGKGVCPSEVPNVALPHCTSKMDDLADLERLSTYGFRGEALSALCEVADVTITTRTHAEEYGSTYNLDTSGRVVNTRTSPRSRQGTTVCVSNLFHNIPVRKQLYRTSKKKKEELKKVEDLIKSFAVIHPPVRFALHHDRSLVWQKTAVPDLKSAMIQVMGSAVFSLMDRFEATEGETSVVAYLPKSSCSALWRSNSDCCYVCVNGRPVCRQRDLLKLLASFGGDDRSHHPTAFVSVTLPPSQVDVNLEPNKTSVLFHSPEEVYGAVRVVLEKAFGPPHNDSSLQSSANSTQSGSDATSLQELETFNNQNDSISETAKGVDSQTAVGFGHSSAKCNSQNEGLVSIRIPTETIAPGAQNDTGNSNGDASATSTNEVSEVNECDFVQSAPLLLQTVLDSVPEETVSDNLISKPIDRDISIRNNDYIDWNSLETEGSPSNSEFTSLKSNPLSTESPNDAVVDYHADPAKAISSGLWSKGAVTSCNGELIQPVRLLNASSKRPLTPPHKANGHKRSRSLDQPTLPEAFSAAMHKPKGSFSYFVRDYIARVREENAEASAAQLAQKLQEMWKSLPLSDRNKYKSMANQKLSNEEGSSISSSEKEPETTDAENTGGAKKCGKPEIVVDFNLDDIRSQLSAACEEQCDKRGQGVRLMGCLNESEYWLGRYGNRIVAINHFRIQETLLYRKLLRAHKLPTEKLDRSLVINEVSLGGQELWRMLLTLCVPEKGQFIYSSDERLLANGFTIRTFLDTNGSTRAEIVEICSLLPFYGVDDLREVLEKICQAKPLEHCRPLKVLHYLKGEAVRMMRNLPTKIPRHEMEQIVDEYSRSCDASCLHDRPILHPIHHLNDSL